MLRAETGYPGEIGQGQSIIQMGFDVVVLSHQALTGQAIRFKHHRRRVDKPSKKRPT
jgi:hypothetical protein